MLFAEKQRTLKCTWFSNKQTSETKGVEAEGQRHTHIKVLHEYSSRKWLNKEV